MRSRADGVRHAAMRPGVDAHARRAVELVRGRPPSAAQARALSQAARFQMLDGRWRDAIETGREAERMATELGLDAIRADALATLGTARDDLGDPRRRRRPRAGDRAGRSSQRTTCRSRARSTTSRGGTPASTCSGPTSSRQRNYETLRRYGHVGQTWWAARPAGRHGVRSRPLGRGARARRGRDRLRRSGQPALLRVAAAASSVPPSAFARGDAGTFDDDIDRSLDARSEGDRPSGELPRRRPRRVPPRCGQAIARARGQRSTRRSRPARTSEFGLELIHVRGGARGRAPGSRSGSSSALPPVGGCRHAATACHRGAARWRSPGRSRRARRAREGEPRGVPPTPRRRAAARRRTHVEEGVRQLERALAFYRGVRATRFIAEAESLLAGAEQQTA